MNVNHVTGDSEQDTKKKRADPTPEEIREMCLQIQAGWTEAERKSRDCYKSKPIEVDSIRHRISDRGAG